MAVMSISFIIGVATTTGLKIAASTNVVANRSPPIEQLKAAAEKQTFRDIIATFAEGKSPARFERSLTSPSSN